MPLLRESKRNPRARAPDAYERHLQAVLQNAESFTACAFLGRGKYERREAPSLEEARKLALAIKRDRPVLIYAIAGPHQVLVEAVG